MITITDGNNYFRRLAEKDPTGMPIRTVLNDIARADHLQIWAFDGYNANKRRRDVFPSYKVGRAGPKDGFFEAVDLLKKVLPHTRAMYVTVPTYEADDVIATMCKSLTGRIHIRSTDKDYLQLINDRITCDATLPEGVTPEWLDLYKATVGDPSDKIPGIKGFGKAGWDAVDKEQLKQFILQTRTDDVAGLTTGQMKWLRVHRDVVEGYLKIVKFFTVEDVTNHLVRGTDNPSQVESILKEFWL